MILICTTIPISKIPMVVTQEKPMYVCVCNAVTENEIQKAIAEGAETVKDLRERLLVTGCCGSCLPSVQQFLENSPRLNWPESVCNFANIIE